MRQIQLLALIGSTKDHSSNQKLVRFIKTLGAPSGTRENQPNPANGHKDADTDADDDAGEQIDTAAGKAADKPTYKPEGGKIVQPDVRVHWDVFPISGLPFFDPDLDKENKQISRSDDHRQEAKPTGKLPDGSAVKATEAAKESNSGADMDLHTDLSPDRDLASDLNRNTDDPQNVPTVSFSGLPTVVQQLRDKIQAADGVLICTPEYVFSLPGILKNALEWLVASTVLDNKPMALITAAASGEKAKESLELIVRTLGGRFTRDTSIHIRGIAGKFNSEGRLEDQQVIHTLKKLYQDWMELIIKQMEKQ